MSSLLCSSLFIIITFCCVKETDSFQSSGIISINFTHTLPLIDIWPSEGFTLKYSVTAPTTTNLQSDSHSHVYRPYTVVSFTVSRPDWQNGTEHFTKKVSLDLSSCNCNHNTCIDCHQHVNLFNFNQSYHDWLGSYTISNDELVSNYTLSSPYDATALITPRVITAHTLRCNISISGQQPKAYLIVPFTFNLSHSCYLRNEEPHTYVVNIWISTLTDNDLSHDLRIDVYKNGSTFALLCDTLMNCTVVEHNAFIISYDVARSNLGNIDNTIPIFFDEKNSLDIYISSGFFYKVDIPAAHKVIDDDGSSVVVAAIFGIMFTIVSIVFCCVLYRRNCYQREPQGYVVDKALVLIIGVSQFNDKRLYLDGVRKNVTDLRDLWENQYHYDVFTCGYPELKSTKRQIMQFIHHIYDQHKMKLMDNYYQSVIVHVISHGSNQGHSFLSSDQKEIELDDIRQSLIDSASERNRCGVQDPLIKLLFGHICRGDKNYSQGKSRALPSAFANALQDTRNEMEDCRYESVPSEFANWAIIWGNIQDRSVSDDGDFTNCICEAFTHNAKGRKRVSFRKLVIKIRIQLQNITKNAEICELSDTLRENKIHFVPCKQRRQAQVVDARVGHEPMLQMVSKQSEIRPNLRSDIDMYNFVQIES